MKKAFSTYKTRATGKLWLLGALLLLAACNSTRYVPDGEHLLDKVTIKADKKVVSNEEMATFVRQHPNPAMFGLFKVQLGIYNWAGTDTTKTINRWLRKIGNEPVIYDPYLTDITEKQLDKLFHNRGYMNAAVTSEVTHPKEKKVRVNYKIETGTPYLINSYAVNIDHPELERIASDSVQRLIKPGKLFDSDMLNEERDRITSRFRNRGYFNFTKDHLHYFADSALNANKADLLLELKELDEVKKEKLFRNYTIRNVNFISHSDGAVSHSDDDVIADSLTINNYSFFYENKRNIRPSVLVNNTHLLPGRRYSDRAVERTYSSINSLSAIKYIDVNFQEVDSTRLDAFITVSPNKLQSISTDVESTYSAGYWGLGGNINYGHRNIFKGSELLSLRGRASYEYQGRSQHAYELGGDAGIKFPTFLLPFLSRDVKQNIPAATEINSTFSYRKLPGEYTGIVTGLAYKYSWSERTHIKHNVDVLNLSYVYYPYISDEYKEYLSTSPYFIYNFQNHLILSLAYRGSYTGFRNYQPLRNYTTMSYSVETAGNVLYAINKMLQSPKDENGAYKLFGIRYAQYVKGDYNISRHQIFDHNNRIVYHAGIGITIPYGNNPLVPFEKRYFSGGANSVRGWTAYRLGPGNFHNPSGLIDYNTQMGDVKIDLNMEYRSKLFWKLESALFLDAGNVWTIRDYDSQPGGAFHFKNFLGQMGVAYGAGLRADFSFFVFRVDLGLKLYNPALSRTERWRTSISKDDYAFNLAIGYPF